MLRVQYLKKYCVSSQTKKTGTYFFCVDDRVSIASSEDKTLDRWLPKHRRQEGFAVFGTSAPAVWPILRITRFP